VIKALNKMAINLSPYFKILNGLEPISYVGKVTKVIGLTIEATGPEVNIGDLCFIESTKTKLLAEVVGFKDGGVLFMPMGNMGGVGPGNKVFSIGEALKVGVGEGLIGRVLDGLGNPIDKGPQILIEDYYPTMNAAPNPLDRNRILDPLGLGVKVLDGLLTVGKGQRVGVFAGSGVGKSTLLGMIARNTIAQVNVIALIGERGREVREFIERDLGEEGLKRSIVIVATSDQPAMVRLKGAFVATAIAEYFRDQGKDVLLFMDSLTRFAMAQREIGLAVGEPPVSRGYTPSVFAILPKLLERTGNSDKGSITALYTVLVDGDDMTEPVTDAARGILDGHIVLSRDLANKNQYPAVDVLGSVSRLMNEIATKEHKLAAVHFRKVLSTYRDAEDLINIGAYNKGSSEEIDLAIEMIGDMKAFLNQDVDENVSLEETIELLKKVSEK
jgi:flagellum-specific ATP synthase